MKQSEQLRLVFLADYPFSERDFERFGIGVLRQYFDVAIYDIANIVNPKSLAIRALPRTTDSRLMTFAALEDVLEELRTFNPHAVISNIGLTDVRQTIYEFLESIDSDICDLRVCLTPGDSITQDPSWKRIVNRVKQTTGPMGVLQLILRKMVSPRIRHSAPHVLVTGGLESRNNVHPSTHVIKAHSLDFDRHLQAVRTPLKPALDHPYAVYLDQVMGFHVDYEFSGLRVPIEPQSFYEELHAYFERFSNHTGLAVVACPHPRGNTAFVRTRLRGIQVTDMSTVDAISNASCVLGHNSTALSFAVLWDKPAILMANRDLIKSWEGPFVRKFAERLGARIDMIDDHETTKYPQVEPVSRAHYDAYIRDFLSEVPNDPRSTWSIVGEELRLRQTK